MWDGDAIMDLISILEERNFDIGQRDIQGLSFLGSFCLRKPEFLNLWLARLLQIDVSRCLRRNRFVKDFCDSTSEVGMTLYETPGIEPYR